MTVATRKPPALRRPRPSGRTGDLRRKVFSSSVMWLLAVIYGFPALWFVLSSLKPAG